MNLFIGTRRENLDLPDGVFPINLGEIYENLPLEHPEVERAIRIGSLVECSPIGDVTQTPTPEYTPPTESKKNGLEDDEMEDE
jgi:hypothetical protein